MKLIEFRKKEVVILPELNIKQKKKEITEKLKKKKSETKEKMDLHREINNLIYRWRSVMAHTKTANELDQTFTLAHIKKDEKYGYSARVLPVDGLALEKLDVLKPEIESGLECMFVCDIPDHKQFAMIKIIKPTWIKHNDIPYTPIKVKPYEWYAGIDIAGTDIVFNVNKTPHLLIAGQQRRGKNGEMDTGITAWIKYCKSNEIELYMFQGAKNDLIKYQNCEQVKCFIMGDFIEFLKVLQYLRYEIDRRTELMKEMVATLKGDNIFHFNSIGHWGKLTYIYIIIDEFISIMPTDEDTKGTKEIKNKIINLLQDVGRFGGALGINYVISHQKPQKELCPTFLKNMSSIRVSFGFDDDICGRIVLGEKYGAYVTGLPARRAYYLVDGKCDMLFTTNLTGRIKPFIEKSFITGHETIFDIINSKNKKEIKPTPQNQSQSKDTPPTQPNTSGKVPKQDFSMVNKTQEEILKENISKIPGFVEWKPLGNDMKVINNTGIPKQTQKPVKKECE